MTLVRGIAAALVLCFSALVAAADVPGATRASNGGCAVSSDWGKPRAELADRVVALVNAHRRRIGLRPLRISPTLTRAAEWKALHMARFRYMRHEDPAPPVGRGVGARLAACGYRGGGWGENIAFGFGSAAAVVGAWLRSPGHRANIERGSFRVIGVGAGVSRGGTLYWSQEFGAQDDSRTAAPRPRPAAPRVRAPLQQGLTTGRLVDAKRKPRPGRWFVARIPVAVADTGTPLASGSVKCDAVLGRRHLRVVVNVVRNGRAVCAWRVPRGSKGQRVVGRLLVRSDGKQAVRWFSRRVG
jgi:uncharacterized protein YkwD